MGVTIQTTQNVNGCNTASFSDDHVLEEDRMPSLKSNGQALEREEDFCDIPVTAIYQFLMSTA